MSRFVAVLAVAVLVFAASGAALADTLTTTDGRCFEGKLISRTADEIKFEIHQYGSTVTMTFDPNKVARIERKPLTVTIKATPASAGASSKTVKALSAPKAPPILKYDKPTYYRVPLRGEVGRTILGIELEKSLADALKRSPTVVVLEVNSPGGLVQEVDRLTAVIRGYSKSLRIVVYVRRALSAAAITSLSSREIYMDPAGLIGAATAYKVGKTGMPEDIDAKMESVWRAMARSSAEIGGHNSLLAEAMIDGKVQLRLVEEKGKKVIKEGRGSNMITRPGRPLTLTAKEAVDCGLAAATVDGYGQLGEALGYKGWVECAGLGTLEAEYWEKVISTVEVELAKLHDQFEENMRAAAENDPTKFTYTVWAKNRKFTSESKKRWEQQSGICTRFLTKAEQNLKAAVAIVEQYPQLQADAEMIKAAQKRIAETRTRIARGTYKTSPVN